MATFRTSLKRTAREVTTIPAAFPEQITRLSDSDSDNNRWRQGRISSTIINALFLEHLEVGLHVRVGNATALGDVKTAAMGLIHLKAAIKLDTKFGTPADATGPVEAEMDT